MSNNLPSHLSMTLKYYIFKVLVLSLENKQLLLKWESGAVILDQELTEEKREISNSNPALVQFVGLCLYTC